MTRGYQLLLPMEWMRNRGECYDWAGRANPSHQSLVAQVLNSQKRLNYEVAEYCMQIRSATLIIFTFDHLLSWDNTPRYGSEAHIVHNSDPNNFRTG